jgi:hypothetical protein
MSREELQTTCGGMDDELNAYTVFETLNARRVPSGLAYFLHFCDSVGMTATIKISPRGTVHFENRRGGYERS